MGQRASQLQGSATGALNHPLRLPSFQSPSRTPAPQRPGAGPAPFSVSRLLRPRASSAHPSRRRRLWLQTAPLPPPAPEPSPASRGEGGECREAGHILPFPLSVSRKLAAAPGGGALLEGGGS